ncbi:hypothetical protein DAT36_04270 [Photobacterium phosphoreum]|nr:hypothetical protein DAT36_04270 [Photobacterium phosphoreum]
MLHVACSDAMRCDAMRCDAMRCDAMSYEFVLKCLSLFLLIFRDISCNYKKRLFFGLIVMIFIS